MVSSTLEHHTSDNNTLKYTFTDLSSIHVSSNAPLDTLCVQHTYNLSNPQIHSMLSAPPPWKLGLGRPIGTPQTVGYSAFLRKTEG